MHATEESGVARALLDRLSLEGLRALQEQIGARIVQLEEQKRVKALEEIERRAHELGLSKRDLKAHFGRKGGSRKAASPRGPVKYRHPGTGQTWSGAGRKPGWVKAFESEGGDLSEIGV